jgi:hypothetical protein
MTRSHRLRASAVLAVIAAVAGPGGGGGVAGGRKWNVRNLLVAIGEEGTVRSSEVVPDEELQDHPMRWTC